MADNYLEKQMEDFRAGKLSRQATAAAVRRARAPLLADKRALVVSPSVDFCAEAARWLSEAGARTAMAVPGGNIARALSQRLGVRYYPQQEPLAPDTLASVAADLLHNWHGIDVVVSDSPLPDGIFPGGTLLLTACRVKE